MSRASVKRLLYRVLQVPSRGSFAGGGGIGSGSPLNDNGVAITNLGTAVTVVT